MLRMRMVVVGLVYDEFVNAFEFNEKIDYVLQQVTVFSYVDINDLL